VRGGLGTPETSHSQVSRLPRESDAVYTPGQFRKAGRPPGAPARWRTTTESIALLTPLEYSGKRSTSR
jgi:hypothetical protein